MALQGSGQIAISDLKTAYGTGANDLASFYRGGSSVWAGASFSMVWVRYDAGNNRNTSVPASGQISLGNFYGQTNTV